MTDYVPTGKPEDGTRYDARAVRREFELIADGINSKSDLNSDNTVSSTSMLIESPATKTFTVETGKDFAPGQVVFIADSADPGANNMTGTLVSYARDTSGIMVASITSKNGSGTKSAWNIGVSNVSGVTLVNNTFTGHQNFARATVASSATTSDIWGALGNQIDFTGIATVTGFPAAPQAGASRQLVCAAGCSFTAGANMLIAGYVSGTTAVCAANDVVEVLAVSLTQFLLTIKRYDGGLYRGTKKLVLATISGRGSTNTKALRFTTTTTNTGTTEWTYVDSATLGGSITILNSGIYTVQFEITGDVNQANNGSGVSINSSELSTSFKTIAAATKLVGMTFDNNGGTLNEFSACQLTEYFPAGTVLVPHLGDSSSVSATGEAIPSKFYLTRLM